jgi:hypothetical protein
MARYAPGRTPSERVPVSAGGRPVNLAGSAPAAVPELTEDRRWQALRAVTWQHEHVKALPLGELAEVIHALGLTGTPRVVGELLDLPCSDCGAPVGSGCVVRSTGKAIPRGHDSRRRAAEAARPGSQLSVACPKCGATPGNRCRTGAETYSRGHRERHQLAERGSEMDDNSIDGRDGRGGEGGNLVDA